MKDEGDGIIIGIKIKSPGSLDLRDTRAFNVVRVGIEPTTPAFSGLCSTG